MVPKKKREELKKLKEFTPEIIREDLAKLPKEYRSGRFKTWFNKRTPRSWVHDFRLPEIE